MGDTTKVHTVLDIRGVTCPITFVRTKLALERMATGEVIRVVVDAASAVDNVPRSLTGEGHTVLGVRETGDGVWEIVARKGGR
ncbi:MAG: sulfurtransferase TusA family protein [Nitrospirota bacterium]|jgi:TusA-related sulfurtransferase